MKKLINGFIWTVGFLLAAVFMLMGPDASHGADNAAGFDVKNQKEIHLRDHWVLYGDQEGELPLRTWMYYDEVAKTGHLALIGRVASRALVVGTWPKITISAASGTTWYSQPSASASRVERAVIRFSVNNPVADVKNFSPALVASEVWLYNSLVLPEGMTGKNFGLRVVYSQSTRRASGPEAIFWRYSYANPATGPTSWSSIRTGAFLKPGLFTNATPADIVFPTAVQSKIKSGATVGINIWVNTPVDIHSIRYYKHRRYDFTPVVHDDIAAPHTAS